jgi:hypothetical protein
MKRTSLPLPTVFAAAHPSGVGTEPPTTTALNLPSLLGELRTWMDSRPPGFSLTNDPSAT